METMKKVTDPPFEHWPKGYACIHFAADGVDKWGERPGLVKKLAQKGVDINAITDDKKTNSALTLACGQGAQNMALSLIDANADINHINGLGKSAWTLACGAGQHLVAQRLSDATLRRMPFNPTPRTASSLQYGSQPSQYDQRWSIQ